MAVPSPTVTDDTPTAGPPERASTRATTARVEMRGWSTVLPRRGALRLVSALRPFLWMFARIVHRVRFQGWERVPRDIGAEGLIVVANHTAGTDPVLAQLRMGASIRWMMDRTQMKWIAGWFWRRVRVIPVDFTPGDSSAFRQALAHLGSGGVVGVFPEGGIERPSGQIRPFLAGAGALVARSRAPVLLLWIHGGSAQSGVFRSLVRPSRSVVTVIGVYRFEGPAARDLRGITATLRHELARVSGWPLNDEPLPHLRRP